MCRYSLTFKFSTNTQKKGEKIENSVGVKTVFRKTKDYQYFPKSQQVPVLKYKEKKKEKIRQRQKQKERYLNNSNMTKINCRMKIEVSNKTLKNKTLHFNQHKK